MGVADRAAFGRPGQSGWNKPAYARAGKEYGNGRCREQRQTAAKAAPQYQYGRAVPVLNTFRADSNGVTRSRTSECVRGG